MDQAAIVVIIPVLDEEESIARVVRAVPTDLVDRVIVADGGSRDRTVERAREAGAEVLGVGRGYGRACLEASRLAAEADVLVFMDGDGVTIRRA